MQDKTNGRYYWKKIDVSGISSLYLSQFSLMADVNNTPFELQNGNTELQFVIDFSRVLDYIDVGELHNEIYATPLLRASEATSESVATLEQVDTFTLQNAMTTEGIEFVHNSSNAAASKWDNRHKALVFMPKTELPKDAYLEIVSDNTTTNVYSNADGYFIFPLGDNMSGFVNASLISRLLPEGTSNYEFDTHWYVTKSTAEGSYKNGLLVADIETTIHGTQTALPSLKITAPQMVYKIRDDVTATVSWKDTPLNHELKVTLMLKADDGSYSSTGISQDVVSTDTEQTQRITIPLAVNKAGSYCLRFTAKFDLITVSQAEYYFIVEN